MIDFLSREMKHLEDLESSLGTPSAQKILSFLVCWDDLPVKEIVKKSQLSASQVHVTLRGLEQHGVVKKIRRGVYALSDAPFSTKLREAYLANIDQVIGRTLHELTKKLDELSPRQIAETLEVLLDQWDPLVQVNYKWKLSSLSEYLVDRLAGSSD